VILAKQDLDIYNGAGFDFPISVVRVPLESNFRSYIYPLSSRAVGDFVLVWNLPVTQFSHDILVAMLDRTELGAEIVSLSNISEVGWAKVKWRFLNSIARTFHPIVRMDATLFSRKTVEQFIHRGSITSNLPELVLADLSYPRDWIWESYSVNTHFSESQYLRLLVNGTRLGTFIPLLLSTVSGCFALFASIYAIFIFIAQGRAPEGWTTLMVVVGLTQAGVLGMLSLIWARLDSFVRNFGKNRDETLSVNVRLNSKN
jgi:hypothetical protein